MSGIERLEGVWNIVPTPFREDGSLDEAGLPRLTEFVAGTGVDGMTILGVLGEAAKLSDAERTAVIRGVIAAAGPLPVCVGVSHAATDRAVAYAREAVALGAHSVMLAPPALARPSDAAVLAHYLAVAGAVDLPVVVQDHPASSGVFMSVELLATIADQAPTCRVVKLEDEPSPPKVARLRAASPDVRVLGGLGAIMLLEELRRGAAGTMTGFGFPELLVEIVGRFRTGDEAGARELFHRILPLVRFENQAGLNLAIRKHVYRRRGAIASERVRAPGPTLDPGTIADLDETLAAVGLADRLDA
ncbi:MAG: dihydrodipicolinate synthase family protein [Candidatus Limnocylindrales bacterium]